MDKVYDVCVVGAGMVGSATARHAAAFPNTSVCLIGPDEPKDKRNTDSKFFGAYYDEGRLSRHTSVIPIWAAINTRAMSGYRQLEKETGIEFYQEIGDLLVDTKKGGFITDNLVAIKDLKVPGIQRPSPAEARKQFPYMFFDEEDDVLFESQGAGVVNPRKFVQALQTSAHLKGCDIFREPVNNVTPVNHSDGSSVMRVTTERGRSYLARKVCLATGSFTEFRDLLPRGVKPDWDQVTHTVILAEVAEKDLEKMKGMPPMVYNGKACRLAMEGKPYEGWGIYLLPPIKYPNGKHYLKLGHHYMPGLHKVLHTHQELIDWFKSKGDPNAIAWLTKVMHYMFPDFKPVSIDSDTCVLTHTHNVKPFIDLLTPNLGVALGGNGMAAKCCDYLGEIAAGLVVTGEWQSDLPREEFKFVHKKEPSKL